MKKIFIVLLGLVLVACNSSTNETIVETNDETMVETVETEDTEMETEVETEVQTETETEAETEMETEEDTDEEVSNDTMQVALYFVKDNGENFYLEREVHETEATDSVATRALELLISADIKDEDAVRPLPENTKVLGITVNDGVATVDFSEEIKDFATGAPLESTSLQAIANTLTEFNTIDEVKILVEGEEVETLWGHVNLSAGNLKRNLDLVEEPIAWVDNLKDGDLLTNTTSIKGSMSVFENTLNYRLLDANGNVLVESYVNGKLNGETRADFDFVIDFEAPDTDTGKLEFYAISAKDGSEFGNTEIEVRFR